MQNVWDTLSLRKHFLELNVREFLGIQGIIPSPPPNTSMGKQYFCQDKVKFPIYVSSKGEVGLQDYSRLVTLNKTLTKG